MDCAAEAIDRNSEPAGKQIDTACGFLFLERHGLACRVGNNWVTEIGNSLAGSVRDTNDGIAAGLEAQNSIGKMNEQGIVAGGYALDDGFSILSRGSMGGRKRRQGKNENNRTQPGPQVFTCANGLDGVDLRGLKLTCYRKTIGYGLDSALPGKKDRSYAVLNETHVDSARRTAPSRLSPFKRYGGTEVSRSQSLVWPIRQLIQTCCYWGWAMPLWIRFERCGPEAPTP